MAIKKVIRFPLVMKDGIKATNISELKENFDPEKIVKYFSDGTLLKWLESRYYEDEAEAVAMLKDEDNEQVLQKLCDIFNVENIYEEIDVDEVVENSKRIAKLKMYTDDAAIIDNIDLVAFDQEELAELYDEGAEKIYLCEGEFNIPRSKNKLTYIEVGNPVVSGLDINNSVELDKKSNSYVEKISVEKFSEDDISEDLADVIGRNEYVITDDYVVFENDYDSFVPNQSLKKDENFDEQGSFRVWKIHEDTLSSFEIPNEYESYRKLKGVLGNKILLAEAYSSEGILIYDLDTHNAFLECKEWNGGHVSSDDDKIAYVDKDNNLRLIDLKTRKKTFIENLEYSGNILLKDNKLFYRKECGICVYDVNCNMESELIHVSGSPRSMRYNGSSIYIAYDFYHTFIVSKYDMKKNKLTELLNEYDSYSLFPFGRILLAGKRTIINDKYFVIKYSDKTYMLNIDQDSFKKLNIKSEVLHNQVGKYLYYKSETERHYRLNVLTGEKVERFIKG